jgi:Zn-dependent protease with chaperone function
VEELICPEPAAVPSDLARPGRGYRPRVALAFIALAAFISVYVALAGWFVWAAGRIAIAGFSNDSQVGFTILLALPLGFLAYFMLRALYFRAPDGPPRGEITPANEPRLFAFLHRLADQAKAPRPHRVFLSARVNAGVFYDVSLLNLVFPSRKNLEIGLGLINVLSLGEVRAVLAHEFGHFAQGAMAVGRWAAVAQRVAAHIVQKRDGLDRFLHRLSIADLRVAWLGWIVRLIVWALRAVLETAFSLVVRAQRVLGHEMERQADLVAVTLSGSDAPVSALHKLLAADIAWDRAFAIAADRRTRGETIDDLLAMQSRVLEHSRRVLDDQTHGVAPSVPKDGRAQHRVFEERIANPPRMWSSHPPNREREDNIKRIYVPCEPDDRSAWLLFADPEASRARVTEAALAALPNSVTDPRPLSRQESLNAVDAFFDKAFLDPRYRGAYLGRSAVRGVKAPGELYLTAGAPRTPLDQLYPETLKVCLEKWKALESECQTLLGLQRGFLQSHGREINFRGKVLRRRELGPTINAVRAECRQARAELEERDREHRTAYLAAAERIGQGWAERLRGLAALLHYADHTLANLRDSRGYLANAVAVAMADRRVTATDRIRIAAAGADAHGAMEAIWEQRAEVRLSPDIAAALGVERWPEALPTEFKLPLPDPDRIGPWLDAVDS